MKLNSFAVAKLPSTPIYQYDVQIGNGAEKRAVILKAWATKVRKQATGEFFIFDGNKLGWSGQNIEREIHVMADLDAEEGRPPGRTSNTFRIVIRKAKALDLSLIRAYFNKQIQMGPEILEAISKFVCFDVIYDHAAYQSQISLITSFAKVLLAIHVSSQSDVSSLFVMVNALLWVAVSKSSVVSISLYG
jgi:N-terminal domain of argonaute